MWRRRALGAGWWLAVGCVFLAPYAQLAYWSFPASTAALLALFVHRWRAAALSRVGLAMRPRQVLAVLVLAAALWAFFEFVLLARVAEGAGSERRGASFQRGLAFPFQALNEELVLGALGLFALVARWRRAVFWSVALAVVFAALHYALYRFGTMDASLAWITLASLAAVGCVRHAAILLAGHVGYAWALHAAWNVVVFSGTWWWVKWSGYAHRLREPEVLQLFLGTVPMLALSTGAALVLLIVLQRVGARVPRAARSGRIGAARAP